LTGGGAAVTDMREISARFPRAGVALLGYQEHARREVGPRLASPMPSKTSSIPGLRKLPLEERRRRIAEAAGIDVAALEDALAGCAADVATADAMVENAIGALALPFGVALNVRVNGADYLVPMAIEEPSVIAATSHAAKRVLAGGGFFAEADASVMVAQIEVHEVRDAEAAVTRITAAEGELLALAHAATPGLCARGGGALRISARDVGDGFVVTHVEVDCRDAMGANLVNTIAEALGPRVADLAKGELGLRILSNYCEKRCVRVTARVPVEALGDDPASGLTAARGIASASTFAERDTHRAVTHNKGIMNGVDAVVTATGNDWRAVEAAAHAFAARTGRYGPLATWRMTEDRAALEGRLEMPLALGTVGGALRAHRGARIALAIVAVSSSRELAMVAAATGLATNLAALRALATEGIQRGHMALHRRAATG
jgi:hydroxymethylglutaryl-CoA reductase